MMEKSRTLKASILVLSALPALYSPAFASGIGRYAGEFMAGGGGARALAMGGAAVASEEEPWALFWNPAGLADVEGYRLGLMHSERFAGIVDYDAASYVGRQPDGRALAVGLLRLGVNGIPFTSKGDPLLPIGEQERIEVDKVVNDGEYALYAARAGRFISEAGPLKGFTFDYGLAPKLLFKHIGSYRAYGLGLDVGARRRFGGERWLQVGGAVRNVCGTVLAWEQTGRKEVIAPMAVVGFAAGVALPPLEADITIAADGGYRFESLGDPGAEEFHAGMEYLVRKVFALRGGTDDGRLTFGGGINLKPVSIDYAFIGHDDLGDTHRISVTAKWGE